MHHKNVSSTSTKSPIVKYLLVIAVGAAVLAGLYFLFGNLNVVATRGIAMVLVYLVVVGLVIAIGGKGLQLLMQKLHAPPRQNVESVAPETEGETISWATWYDRLVKFLTLGKEQKLREASADLARIQPGETVLDVGCGTGSLTIVAGQRAGINGQVYGTDPAPQMIEVARDKGIKAGVNVDFRVGVVEKIDFLDEIFDVVLSSLMMHHLPGDLQQKALAEIYRVLKPGGRLLVVDFEPPTNPVKRALLRPFLGNHMLHMDNAYLPSLFEEAGFAKLQHGRTNSWSTSYVIGQKLN